MRKNLPALLLCGSLLAACNQSGPTPLTAAPTPETVRGPMRAVGQAFTIRFSGLGSANPTATVEPAQLASVPLGSLALTNQQTTVVPVRVLTRGVVDIPSAGYRYVYAVISVTSSSALQNVSFLGVRTTGTLPASTHDTAISALIRAPGGPAYTATELDTLAASIRPAQASNTDPTTGLLRVLPNTNDSVQYLPEADLTFNPDGMLGLLPYGFTVLNASGGRTLATGTEANRMIVGMKVPLQANAVDNPYAFSFTAVPVSDSVLRVTQSLEGLQSGNSLEIQKLAQQLNATLTVPPGSPVLGTPLCRLRTGGSVANPSSTLFNQTGWIVPGANGHHIAPSGAVVAHYCGNNLDPATVTAANVFARTTQSAPAAATPSGTASTVTVPARTGNYHAGEQVEVTLTSGVTAGGTTIPASPYVFSFRAAAAPAPVSYSTPVTPRDVVWDAMYPTVADMNNDGKLDVIVSHPNDNVISVLLGNGDGTLQGRNFYNVGLFPTNIRTADINRDGYLDLIVRNQNQENYSVLVNKKTGLFNMPQNLSMNLAGNTASPNDFSVNDMNGDGIPDLVSLSQYPATATLRLGKGDGTFSAATSIIEDFNFTSMGVADFNHDGKLDLVFSAYNGVNVLLSNGDGTFQPKKVTSRDQYSYSVNPGIEIADLNNDGENDLIAGASGSSSVLLGKGDGTFKTEADWNIYTPNGSYYGAGVADMDGDGKLDLVPSGGYSYTAYSKGYGDGTFGNPVVINDGSNNYGYFKIADMNNDGKLDIVKIFNNNVKPYVVGVSLSQ